MFDRFEELEIFKTRINLSEYAAFCGYVLDRSASSRNSAVMKHPNGDKVVVARDRDGHWISFACVRALKKCQQLIGDHSRLSEAELTRRAVAPDGATASFIGFGLYVTS